MKLLKQANIVGVVFMGGVKEQLAQEWTWSLAAAIGLHQGLKYTGNIKNGINGAAATLMVLAGVNGVYNVVSYWDKIKEIAKED